VIIPLLMLVLEQNDILTSKVRNYSGFKWFLMGLVLGLIVLTNNYKGILTADTTSPTPNTYLTRTEEALEKGYDIIVQIPKAYRKMYANMLLSGYNRLDQLKMEYIARCNLYQEGYSALLDSLLHFTNPTLDDKENMMKIAFTIKAYEKAFRSVSFTYSPEISTEEELAKCNKSIFVGDELELEEMSLLVSSVKASRPIYSGTDKFITHSRVLEIGPISWDRMGRIHTRSQCVIHSGIFKFIYDRDEKRVKHKLQWGLQQEKLKPGLEVTTLQSNYIICSFVIYGTGMIVGILQFGIEFVLITLSMVLVLLTKLRYLVFL